jgi:carbonic anhydrase
LAPLLLTFAHPLCADETMPTPNLAFDRLKKGNARFVSGKRECIINLLKELKQLQTAQTPYAAILSCSDSRIPPELIFDETLGKLFIIRVAGNIATDATIGSIEYAVAVLKVPLVIVLGHDDCGVIVTALKGVENVPPFVRDVLNEASFPVAQTEKVTQDFATQLPLAIIKNVEFQMRELLEKSATLKEAVDNDRTLFRGGVIHLSDGAVEWCPCQ